jgi:hypothetical protein
MQQIKNMPGEEQGRLAHISVKRFLCMFCPINGAIGRADRSIRISGMTADTPTIPMRPDDNDNNNARINDELVPAFRARYAPPDEEIARGLLQEAATSAVVDARVKTRTIRLVAAIRAKTDGVGGIEAFLREYSLSTKEGLALMVLAEALLRVPDSTTADQLIEENVGAD